MVLGDTYQSGDRAQDDENKNRSEPQIGQWLPLSQYGAAGSDDRNGAEITYGVPPEQVIGSSGKLKFEIRDGEPVLVKLLEIDVVNDNVEKPAAIQKHIGRRPIASFGNSDGDLEMLKWTTAGKGARFALLVHHNDATREWAYDRSPSIGQLDKALDEANAKGWTVVDMKNDWRSVFPFE